MRGCRENRNYFFSFWTVEEIITLLTTAFPTFLRGESSVVLNQQLLSQMTDELTISILLASDVTSC